MSLVYKHTFPNGKVYIGITHYENPEKRWRNGNGYSRNIAMKNAIKKYGWENILHEILISGLSKSDASLYEQKFIAEYHSNERDYGYNFTSGGELGAKHNIESRKKLSNSRKGKSYNVGIKFTVERKQKLRENHADFRGDKNPCYGKKWTQEEIAKRQSHRVYKTGKDNPCSKPILQFSLTNDFIKEWDSISDASKNVCSKTSIKQCLSGKYKKGGGYIWKYKENNNGR